MLKQTQKMYFLNPVAQKKIILLSSENSTCKLRPRKENIQTDISKKELETACANNHSTFINACLRMIQYQQLIRKNMTPVDFNKYEIYIYI